MSCQCLSPLSMRYYCSLFSLQHLRILWVNFILFDSLCPCEVNGLFTVSTNILCQCPSLQLINICSSDGQRVYEAVSVGCLLAGGPLVGILGLSYTAYFLGPTALVGSAIFIFFYPAMVGSPLHVS